MAVAQKKLIDSNAISNWTSLGQAFLSNDGKYVSYSIENEPVKNETLVIQSIENNWIRKFIGAKSSLQFEGHFGVFINQNDSLVIVTLGKNTVRYIPNVVSFQIGGQESNRCIVYITNNKKFTIYNLATSVQQSYPNVLDVIFDENSQNLILKIENIEREKVIQNLKWIDLKSGKNIVFWSGIEANNLVLDAKHDQFAFKSADSIFYYKKNESKAILLINKIEENDGGLEMNRLQKFSNDGERLFLDLKEKAKPTPNKNAVQIWSYLDHKLQSQQEMELGSKTFAAVIDLKRGDIRSLEQKWESLSYGSANSGSACDTVGVITFNELGTGGGSAEKHWNVSWKESNYLISIKNGKKTKMEYFPYISPQGKYAVYFDEKQGAFISYNIKTGVFCNISKLLPGSLNSISWQRDDSIVAGWLANDEAILLYDKYDIWCLDLSGQKSPINLTMGYGRKNNIVLSLIKEGGGSQIFKKETRQILTAYDLTEKKNGFYSLNFSQPGIPRLLSMGNYIYDTKRHDIPGYSPIKAKGAEIYLVSRMSATEAPNYFITKDFVNFKQLSNLEPQKDYNWYSTELHTWKSLDGRTLQGVLYKPENFDPKKKYPVIFYYYERKSDKLNAYISPEVLCSGCQIDIPTYVSNGYLVFTPDIYYSIGNPMQGTYDALVSVAKHIGNLPFVNSKKMALQGCSWGAVQTNYLVTHTNLFAAACSASGIADWVSNYGRLDGGWPRSVNQGMYEGGQFRMGGSIWETPSAYIKNSPIFQLDKLTTPLLIMHGNKDTRCSFDDAIEFFTGLRRLGKKSWLLAYPEGDHGLYGEEAKDFSVRMMQFFDHYLKDKPAPVWMTQGVPAERRGLDDGLASDTNINTPGPGLLTADEQRKVDSMMARKPILIELK